MPTFTTLMFTPDCYQAPGNPLRVTFSHAKDFQAPVFIHLSHQAANLGGADVECCDDFVFVHNDV
jgi:hypothetical protein